MYEGAALAPYDLDVYARDAERLVQPPTFVGAMAVGETVAARDQRAEALGLNEPSSLSIDEKLLLEIARSPDKRITFAQFMDISLYDSQDGYYASGKAKIGNGHFVTAPTAHRAFGGVIANAANDMWLHMGSETFDIVEQGAGTGALARDALAKIRQHYPELYKRTRYTIVERSHGLIERQRQTVGDLPVQWIHGSAIDLPVRDIEGLMLSNELPDAFGVHNLTRDQGKLEEYYIGVNGNAKFVEVRGEVSPEVNDPLYTDLVREGRRVAVSPALVKWQESLGNALKRGFVLTADYFASDHPEAHLPRTYGGPYGSHSLEHAFTSPGDVDITTSVNRELLYAAGERAGLQVVSDESQDAFLVRHGLDEEAERINAMEMAMTELKGPRAAFIKKWVLRRGEGVLRGMSARTGFSVIVQSKGL
jgi:SAM-dependent MidA family methyltransferase